MLLNCFDNLVQPFRGLVHGAGHGHPQNNAPAPEDALWIYNNYTSSGVASAPSNELQGYINHAFFVTNTANQTYVITVRDWSAYVEKAANGSITESNFLYWTGTYQSITHNQATVQEAAQYALLKMFDGSINLYLGGTGSTTFRAKTIDPTSSLVTDINCP